MNDMYSKYAKDYASAIDDNIYNAHYDRPSLMSLISGNEFECCLDMGCGPGAYIDSLKLVCRNIVGIDQSEEFIKILSEKFPSVKAYCHDLNQDLIEADDTFDLVISPLAIHYIKDLTKLFSEVNRVMKKDGVFAFSTHHPIVDFQDSNSGDYFECEKLTQVWNTLGDKTTEVTFYRRSMSEILNSLFQSGFVVDGFSEGKVDECVKEISEKSYLKLKTKPQFIFIRARKL